MSATKKEAVKKPATKKATVEETEASPEMAESANAGIKKMGGPEKKELTEEEKTAHERAVIIQYLIEGEKTLSEIVREIEDKGFSNFVYEGKGTVEIPDAIFANLINYVVAVKAHNENMTDILKKVLENTATVYQNIFDSNASLALASQDFQIEFSKKHIELSEAGFTKSPEEIAERNAKENVKEIPVAKKKATKKKKVKARGTKEEK